MCFIELGIYKDRDDLTVWVNFNLITKIYSDGFATHIVSSDGLDVKVDESPNEIFSLIRKIKECK